MGYASDGMENEPIDLELADVTVTGTNLADAANATATRPKEAL